jgi:putative long chain acyl-CoA synthase
MVLVTKGEGGALRTAQITNRRWALSALGAAAACTLKPADTVYCCLPLHHPAGLLVSVGGALVSGARLALATPRDELARAGRLDAAAFWSEVHTYGATVVFYAGEMARELLRAPPSRGERASSLRLFAGSGMRVDAWKDLHERTGASVLEFYASTEGPLVLANAAGEKIGALGRPLPGSAEVALLAYDVTTGGIARDAGGRALRVREGEPGILSARLDPALKNAPRPSAIARDVFAEGDAWITTGDLARIDEGGDYWLVDRAADAVRTARGLVPTRALEDALYALDAVDLAVVYGVPKGGAEVPVAAVVLREGRELDRAALAASFAARHPKEEWPELVRVVGSIPMTEGFRLLKAGLRAEGLAGFAGPLFRLDVERGSYA